MVRPFLVTLLPQFGPKYATDSERVRRHKFELAKPLMAAHWTDEVAVRLKVDERLRLHLVAHERPELLLDVVEFIKSKKRPDAVLERGGRRVYLAYPHFRSPSARPSRLPLPGATPRGTRCRGVPGGDGPPPPGAAESPSDVEGGLSS